MPSAVRRTTTQTLEAVRPGQKQAGQRQAGKRAATNDLDLVTSSADVSAFLSLLPTDAASCVKDFETAGNDSYQSCSSGNSSPQHEEWIQPPAPAPPAAAPASDINFHVDDIEMWEVLEALSVPAPPAQRTAEKGLIKQVPEPFSPPHSSGAQSRAVSISPVKSATPSTAKASGAVKRPLPCARPVDVAAPAAADEISELGLEPLESCLHDDSNEEACPHDAGERGDIDPAEEKRLKRMRRNRESAAMSRNRKKAYIEELEAKVAALSSSVQALQSENWTLKQECALFRSRAGADAVAPEVLPSGASSNVTPEDDLSLSLEPLVPGVGELDEPGLPPPAAGPSASHPVGSLDSSSPSGRKVGTVGLALMSALTFVTLSANSGALPWSRSAGHSPSSRVLMSVPDEVLPHYGDEPPLWPALEHEEASPYVDEDYVSALPPPVRPPAFAIKSEAIAEERDASKDAAPGRVLMLPRNSSWADALRVEAAENRAAAEKQLMLAQPQYALHSPATETVYEPTWKAEEEEFAFDELDYSPEAEAARRFIFCARAYTFDVASSRAQKRPASSPVSTPSPSRELELPTMPARFRHAAASVPRLTDGSSGGNESGALPLPSPHYPVVSMLLPSAALRGVVSGVGDEHAYDGMGDNANMGTNDDALGGELMQVSCQVLNASRWGGA